jgi:hypothetical protein
MSHSVKPVRRFMRAIALVAAVAGMSLAGLTLPAHAAPAAPTGLTANDAIIPTLSWDHVPGATQYVVELSKTADVAQRIGGSAATVNRHYVPVQPLPWSSETLTLYWRVAAKDSTQGDFSAWTPITRSAGYAAPVITSPAPGNTFSQPGDPATLTWEPVAGAQEYEVEISPDSSFTDPTLKTTARTVAPTHVVSAPQVDTTYWFKVRARLSSSTSGATYSDFSAPRSYSVSALPQTQRVAPATDTTVVDDAVLDWDPILGARTYDLQVATDPSFGSIVHEATNITGTSYARPQSLNNDQYYWRVRARDVAGNVPTWNSRPTWRFERDWPDLPMPVYPAAPGDVDAATPNDVDAGVTVGDPFHYEWEPVRFASMYKIELATDANFSTIIGTCFSRGTTYTPASEENGKCMPLAESTYWWRITAMDQYRTTSWDQLAYPITSQNVFHDARFTYSPDRVTLIAPAPGATVEIPTMTWEPLAGAARYRVSWTSVSSGSGSSSVTAATSFTPPTLALGDYKWQVVGITSEGREGSPLLSGQRTFTVAAQAAATAAEPNLISPLSGTFGRFPALTWEPVVGAVNYRVRVRVAGGTGWDIVTPTFAYPAGTDPSSGHLASGAYEWTVDALNAGGGIISTSPLTGLFDIAQPATVTGQANAMSMAGYADGDVCSGFECTDLRQTPILRWDPDDNTGYYKVWISRNDSFSNLVPPGQLGKSTNPFRVPATVWTPTTTLQESNAGEAYFWAVQPCTYDDKCAPNPVPVNSFNKLSNAVDTIGPGVSVVDGVPQGGVTIPTVSDDVTLSWHDLLDTNTNAAQGSSSLSTHSTQTGREYEVQVAVDHTFSTLLDTQFVDQRRYTSFDDTYPEGNIYWRVRGFDPSGNPLPWSTTRAVNKQSPRPTLNALVGAQGPTPMLSWQPLNFASSYELELYPQGSNTPKIVTTSNQVKWSAASSAHSLAPGQYEWRVRRKDARNRFGGWSDREPLTVSDSLVALNAPTSSGVVAPRDSVFSWQAIPGASEYKIILTSPTGAQTVQVTKATAWAPVAKLASGTWTWRVEPRDTAGVGMGSSASQTFLVSSELGAEQATRIEGSGQLDSVLTGYAPVWSETPDSVTYQWYRGSTAVGDGTLSYTVTTADLNQKITLRATASKGGHVNALSTSNAITAVQGPAAIPTNAPTITGTGFVGETLIGNPPAWAQTDVTNTFRWLVNGASAGTAQTFIVRIADIGKDITFEVTGHRTNYANAVVASAPVTGKPGGALQATVQPVITGTASAGSALTVSPGTWSQPSPSLKYQWLRTGAPIPNATGSSYRLTPNDAGTDVSVTVLASKAGFADGAASASAVAISKLVSTTVATLSATRIKPGKRVKIGMTVTVPGVAGPVGQIKVFDGAKKLKTLTLVSTRDGKLTWRLPKLKKGKHKIKAVYLGNGSTAGSKSKRIKLFVVR